MILSQTKTALAPGLTASFLADLGQVPYTYEVLPCGAGGSIDSDGIYTAPGVASSDPKRAYDYIRATDFLGNCVEASILVGSPLLLFCEIIEREMGLDRGRVYLWDQKIFQPTDAGIYIAVSNPSSKPFASTIRAGGAGGSWDNSFQAVNMQALMDIDIMSRGPAARDRKEEIILALGSLYSEFQQEANSFSIGRLPPGARFVNLSFVDGAAIPYRFRISVNMQYAVTKTKAVDYFDTFTSASVTVEP